MNYGPLLCEERWEGTHRIRLIFPRFPVCLSAFSRVTAALQLPCIHRTNILDCSSLLYDFTGDAYERFRLFSVTSLHARVTNNKNDFWYYGKSVFNLTRVIAQDLKYMYIYIYSADKSVTAE